MPSGEMCRNHPSTPAAGKCNACGAAICRACIKELGYFCSNACRSKVQADAPPQPEAAPAASSESITETAQLVVKLVKYGMVAAVVVVVLWIASAIFLAVEAVELWSHGGGDSPVAMTDPVYVASQSVVVFVEEGGEVVALDAKSGRPRWQKALGKSAFDGGVTSAGGKLIVETSPAATVLEPGTGAAAKGADPAKLRGQGLASTVVSAGGVVSMLDKPGGAPVWNVTTGPGEGEPLFLGGRVYVGVGGGWQDPGEQKPVGIPGVKQAYDLQQGVKLEAKGKLLCLDGATGKQLWEAEPGGRPLARAGEVVAFSSRMAVRLLESGGDTFGQSCKLSGFDASSGKLRWSYQCPKRTARAYAAGDVIVISETELRGMRVVNVKFSAVGVR